MRFCLPSPSWLPYWLQIREAVERRPKNSIKQHEHRLTRRQAPHPYSRAPRWESWHGWGARRCRSAPPPSRGPRAPPLPLPRNTRRAGKTVKNGALQIMVYYIIWVILIIVLILQQLLLIFLLFFYLSPF